MSDIICVDGLIKEYAGIKVVDGVSFSVNKGEIYGLLGRNGAGKTTIMKILLGLANPTSGKVSIFGKKSVKKGWMYNRKSWVLF